MNRILSYFPVDSSESRLHSCVECGTPDVQATADICLACFCGSAGLDEADAVQLGIDQATSFLVTGDLSTALLWLEDARRLLTRLVHREEAGQ